MPENCFCHLGGFAVKDATARKEIENMKTGKQDTLEWVTDEDIEAMFNGTYEGAEEGTD